MNTRIFLAHCLVPVLMMLLNLQSASAQKCGWFSGFKIGNSAYGDGHWGLDSIPFGTRLIQQKVVNDICCYEFEVSYKDDTRRFCIGIADSIVYTFKNNKFKSPKELLSLKNDTAHQVRFFTERCEAIKMYLNNEEPYFKDVVVFTLNPEQSYELFSGVFVKQIHLHSTRGLFFSFSLDGEFWTYGTLGYL